MGQGILESSDERYLAPTKLFHNTFISRCSRFDSFLEMTRTCGLDPYSKEDLRSEQWNLFVVANTSYNSWVEMYEDALEEYADKLCDKVAEDLIKLESGQ